jgi:PAS domain S-box-containing protein
LSLVLEKYRQAIRDKKTVRWEEVTDYPTGRKIGEVSVAPILDANGCCTRFVGTVHDITERKRLDEEVRLQSEALRDSEERFRTIAETSFDAILTVDLEGKITYASPATVRITGYSEKELLGAPMQTFLPESEIPNLMRIFGAAMMGEDSEMAVLNILMKNGSIASVEFHGSPILKRGELIGFEAVARDITERTRMEDEMRVSKERLEYVIASNPAVIFTGKPHSDYADFDSTYMSGSVTQLLGYEPHDFIADPGFWRKRVHPEDRPHVRAAMPHLFKDGHVSVDYRFMHKNGSYRWVHEEVTVMRDAAGSPRDVTGYWTDITERKGFEEMRDRLIAAATHELRTPLGPLKVHVDYALSGKLGPIPEKLKPSLQVMKTETDQLIALTEALLDIRRLQSGKFELNLQLLDLREVIDQSIRETQIILDVKKQHLHLEAPEKPLQLQGDATRLVGVLVNLLSNASKYSPEQGKITLTANEEADVIMVRISDMGIGISREDLSRVFEPFAPIKKPLYLKGPGLGLSISKGIVEAHGGKIWVESEGEGKGSTFTFTLPKPKEKD